jgi:hypothetical protein
MADNEKFNPVRDVTYDPRTPRYRITKIYQMGKDMEEDRQDFFTRLDALNSIGHSIGQGNQMIGFGLIKITDVVLTPEEHALVESTAQRVHDEREARDNAAIIQGEYHQRMREYQEYLRMKAEWDGKAPPVPPEDDA